MTAKDLILSPSTNSSQQDKEEDCRRPTHRVPGGSRGCNEDRIVALIPTKTKTELGDTSSVLELTVEESPTFWFYIPKLNREQVSAKFSLVNKDNEEIIFEQSISVSDTSGIISFRLNRNLELDREYKWLFSINRSIKSSSVEGLIKRIKPDHILINQLAQAKSQHELVDIYTSNGIWHDAVTNLAELKINNPKDPRINDSWFDLLEPVGLQDIATKPFVNCCSQLIFDEK